MSLARVQFFSISLDGFGTGEGQSLDAPFGHAGERLHEWMFVTRWWGEMVGQAGGTGGVDDASCASIVSGGSGIRGCTRAARPTGRCDRPWPAGRCAARSGR
jgi:hypothetical protein